jgi:hypothetical protein
MISDLYTSLTAREQRAFRWSAAAAAVALWLSMAWMDPMILLIVPLIGGAFYVYRIRHRGDEPEDDDADWL